MPRERTVQLRWRMAKKWVNQESKEDYKKTEKADGH